VEPDPRIDFPLMCLTQDGTGLSHGEQASRLAAAGARIVQLRMKGASAGAWLSEARAAAEACHSHGAILIVNDSVPVALGSGADGVHLGTADGGWAEARRLLGPGMILGGTVNTPGEARLARECSCLDYAGVGPLRFTTTKAKLSPLLGMDGIRALLAELGGLPAWVIGGVRAEDLPAIRSAGARGAAVSSAVHEGGRLEESLGVLLAAWEAVEPSRIS
jgi:thiamine-phosphate pyrophosphorylase